MNDPLNDNQMEFGIFCGCLGGIFLSTFAFSTSLIIGLGLGKTIGISILAFILGSPILGSFFARISK